MNKQFITPEFFLQTTQDIGLKNHRYRSVFREGETPNLYVEECLEKYEDCIRKGELSRAIFWYLKAYPDGGPEAEALLNELDEVLLRKLDNGC